MGDRTLSAQLGAELQRGAVIRDQDVGRDREILDIGDADRQIAQVLDHGTLGRVRNGRKEEDFASPGSASGFGGERTKTQMPSQPTSCAIDANSGGEASIAVI